MRSGADCLSGHGWSRDTSVDQNCSALHPGFHRNSTGTSLAENSPKHGHHSFFKSLYWPLLKRAAERIEIHFAPPHETKAIQATRSKWKSDLHGELGQTLDWLIGSLISIVHIITIVITIVITIFAKCADNPLIATCGIWPYYVPVTGCGDTSLHLVGRTRDLLVATPRCCRPGTRAKDLRLE